MQTSNEFTAYIKTVCSQIRFSQVHPEIERELACHMREQQQAYLEEGMDDHSATKKTIEDMGDPVVVGGQLDLAHRPKPDKRLLLFAAIMVAAAVFIRLFVMRYPGPDYWISLFVGVALCFALYYVDYTLFARFAWLFLGLLLFCIVVPELLLTGFRSFEYFHELLGAFSMLFVPVYCGILYKLKAKRYLGLGISFALLFIPVLFFLILPSVSILLMVGLTCYILLIMAAAKEWFSIKRRVGLILTIAPVVTIIALLLLRNPFFAGRFSYMVGENNLTTRIVNDMLQGIQPFGSSFTLVDSFFEPISSSDDSLLYILLHYGIVPAVLLGAGMIAFVVVMLRAACRQKNAFASLIAYGCAILYCIQCAIFLVSNALIPGFFTVPFLFGSSATVVVSMIILGIFLSACKWNGIVSEKTLFQRKMAVRVSGTS